MSDIRTQALACRDAATAIAALDNGARRRLLLDMAQAIDSTQFSAVRCSTRSVTWPELRISLITRTTVAGEVDMLRAASISAVMVDVLNASATK